MSDQFLHAREVATLLNIKISTVYALCRRGELVHIRLGEGRRRPLIRFRREDLDQFLQDRTIGALPATK
ncbi:MAG: helix-turn-helix domain-containing protein [Acidobacteriia bacterium]|nr:helix-turn-helix domain-containing protein [Terriglobia bacterium]